ncbi:MAG: ABC transporter permease [Candidatus Diapherotrites archaeon]
MGKGIISRRAKGIVLSLALPLAIIFLWEIAVDSGVFPRALIASPYETAVGFFVLLFNGKLLLHSAISISRLAAGFVIGALLGIILGTIVGVYKAGEAFFSPTMQALAPIPAIAWTPLLIIFLGIDEASKIGLIAIGVFFVVYFAAVQGIRSTDQKFIELSHSYAKKRRQLISDVLLPSALPSIFSGLRIALALSWILLIAGEIIVASNGLGWLIWDARNFSRADDMLVGMIAIGIWGKLSDNYLEKAEKWFTKWRTSFKGE